MTIPLNCRFNGSEFLPSAPNKIPVTRDPWPVIRHIITAARALGRGACVPSEWINLLCSTYCPWWDSDFGICSVSSRSDNNDNQTTRPWQWQWHRQCKSHDSQLAFICWWWLVYPFSLFWTWKVWQVLSGIPYLAFIQMDHFLLLLPSIAMPPISLPVTETYPWFWSWGGNWPINCLSLLGHNLQSTWLNLIFQMWPYIWLAKGRIIGDGLEEETT